MTEGSDNALTDREVLIIQWPIFYHLYLDNILSL
jgi:hypothetical protein